MLIGDVDIGPLLKARAKFEIFRYRIATEQEQAGAIQAFEYTYELAWKTMKRLLDAQGIVVQSPRATFREAALNELIRNPEIWFDFIKVRNITVHTYDEEEIAAVLACLPLFSKELTFFIEQIGGFRDSAV